MPSPALYTRAFATAVSTGSFSWLMRASATDPNDDLNFAIGSGSSQKIIIGFRPTGNIIAYDSNTSPSAALELVPTYIANRNYRIEVEWDDAVHPDQYRVRVDYGTWSSWIGTNGSYSTMDGVFMDRQATNVIDFWIDAFNAPGGSSGIIEGQWVLGARIKMRTATQSVAADWVRTPTELLEGRVLDFGLIDRSISAPSAGTRVGDCVLRLDDNDLRWRNLLTTQTGLRRLIEIFRVTDGALLGGFEVTKFSFGDGYVEIRGADIFSKWKDVLVPMLGTRINFTWLAPGIDEFFMPILFGRKFSSGSNPQGVIACPHMGPTTKVTGAVAVDRYSISRTICFFDGTQYCIVYRKLSSDADFQVVAPAEYTITIDEPFNSDGKDYNPTYLDFLAVQDADALVRVDAYGSDRSAAIGGLPQQMSTTTDPLRNPIDFLSIIMFDLSAAVGGDTREERYNTASWIDVRDYFASLPTSYACDVAETQQLTFGNILAKWQSTFQADFFADRHYQYTVAATHEEHATRDVLTDNLDFIGIQPQTAPEAFNRITARYDPIPATGEWAGSWTYDNAADQTELGNVDYQGNVDVISAQSFDIYYTAEFSTAVASVVNSSFSQSLGSHRVQFIVPTPAWFEGLELAGQIGITHARGIGGAWVNEEFKILSIRHDLSQLRTTVEAVMRLPVTY